MGAGGDDHTMSRRRHTPEQIIRKLREGERLLGEQFSVEDVCKHLEISEATWHRWQNQYGVTGPRLEVHRSCELRLFLGLGGVVARQTLWQGPFVAGLTCRRSLIVHGETAGCTG